MNRHNAKTGLVVPLIVINAAIAAAQGVGPGVEPRVGPSINMVTGTGWPNGDPFLQRQNEPSMAVSSRNSLHLLAGANDYRTVDLPGLRDQDPEDPTAQIADAWLGLFKSFDGGLTWKSTLIPGYPQDSSGDGRASPIKGMQAGADPVVRAGTNGMFYYTGLALERTGTGRSRIFVARYLDDNLPGGGDTIRYLSTSVIKEGDADHFQDKPAFAADIPRSTAKTCTVPGNPAQTFPAGRIYVAWTEFTKSGNEPVKKSRDSQILFSRSEDCGETWSAPKKVSGDERTNQGASLAIDQGTGAVFVTWRVFGPDQNSGNGIYVSGTLDGDNFSAVTKVADVKPFDQGTTGLSFRTNAYPVTAVIPSPIAGRQGTLVVAWSQRMGGTAQNASGDARIVFTSSFRTGDLPWECLFESHNPFCVGGNLGWTTPQAIDNADQRGHQFMPSLMYSSGKLTAVWYDHRDTNIIGVYKPIGKGKYEREDRVDGVRVFDTYIQDPRAGAPSARRHTLDVRLAQATVASGTAIWGKSIRVSQYAFGTRPTLKGFIQQLELDPPNLPMFQLGTVPFFGDYIDVAGATFVSDGNGAWRFNTLASDPENIHVTWTDNRNVVQPPAGDWRRYTPAALGAGTSRFDETEMRMACSVGSTGSRNQDIYTARISQGLVAGAKTNGKPLGVDPRNPAQAIQRAFPITVQNTTAAPERRRYLLRIANQPPGGRATFLQFSDGAASELTVQLMLDIPALSSTARTVFMTSENPNSSIRVDVIEVDMAGIPVTGGARTSVALNRDGYTPAPTSTDGRSPAELDIFNPDISNPDISNPDISNPDISNPDISNPDISNPAFSNPDISNTGVSNVTIVNPDISNPDISNPDISNIQLANPDISNPDISNPDISNSVLTDVTWAVTNRGKSAAVYAVKLLENSTKPSDVQLQLLVSKRYNTPTSDGCALKVRPNYVNLINVPSPTFTDRGDLTRIGGDTPTVSIAPGERILITLRSLVKATDPRTALLIYDASTAVTPVVVPESNNNGTDVRALPLTIVTGALALGQTGRPYTQTLAAAGGAPPYRWSLGQESSLPPGLALDAAGIISGTPSGSGVVEFIVFVADSAARVAVRTMLINIAPRGTASVAVATASPLAPGSTGQEYSAKLSSSGGTGPFTWSRDSGALPPGLALSAAGEITGTPTRDGIFKFVVRVTDAQQDSDSKTLAMIVRFGLPEVASIRSQAPGATGIAVGSWVTIQGSGLSNSTRRWNNSDFINNRLPLALDGVSVTFGGVPAAVSFISSGEVHALCPTMAATGAVAVEVKGPRGTAKGMATIAQFAPAFYLFPDAYVAAIHTDGTYAAKPGLEVPDATSTRVAKAGDILMLFGGGFGATAPPVSTGEIFQGAAELTGTMTITVGGVNAEFRFAGISAAGLYQFNVVMPKTLRPDDHEVMAEIGGVKTPAGRLITIGQ